MTEKEKMLAGEIYNANYDEELIKERIEVKDKWRNRVESNYSIIGDIIFFDWKDENGNQDGTSDR